MSMLQMSELVLIFVVQIFAVCKANNSRPMLRMVSCTQVASRLSTQILVSVSKLSDCGAEAGVKSIMGALSGGKYDARHHMSSH